MGELHEISATILDINVKHNYSVNVDCFIAVAVIPPFNSDGLLPPGEFDVTFDELRQSILITGPQAQAQAQAQAAPRCWDSAWRAHLVRNLEVLTRQLWQVGVTAVFADGSFVEEKDHPNDIDGYFECELARLKSGQLARDLNRLDPGGIWTWDPASRRSCRGSPKRQLPMWHKYRIELYPHVPGLLSGICDKWGNESEFPSAFRRSRRDGKPRGILKLLSVTQP